MKNKLPNIDEVMRVLGQVTWLAHQSDLQSSYPVGRLMERVWPSLQQGDYRLYTNAKGQPIGFCNWIRVSEGVLQEILSGEHDLEVENWNSGEIIFFPEMIAPFGHLRQISKDLRDGAMKEQGWCYSLRGYVRKEGEVQKTPRVLKWRGRKVAAAAKN